MIVLGHRGGRGEGWPTENSLEAFARALEEGAAGVELDVRLCGSGEPVVLHDPSLARVTNGEDRRSVHAVSRRELPALAGGVAVPDLESALDLLRGKIVNVELKSDVPSRLALVRAVIRAVARVRGVDVSRPPRRGPRSVPAFGGSATTKDKSLIVFSSFDPRIVVGLAALAPAVPRGLLIGERTAPLATMLPIALRPAIVAAHLDDALLDGRGVARLRRAGLRVVAWTVNDVSRVETLRAIGVEWVITDQPGSVVSALR